MRRNGLKNPADVKIWIGGILLAMVVFPFFALAQENNLELVAAEQKTTGATPAAATSGSTAGQPTAAASSGSTAGQPAAAAASGSTTGTKSQAPVLSSDPLPPDKYFQLLLERQRIEISSLQWILKLLENKGNEPLTIIYSLQSHEQERQAKIADLFREYGITPESYYRSYRGSDVVKARSKYLDAHPQIRDQLAKNSADIQRLNAQIQAKLKALKLVGPAPK